MKKLISLVLSVALLCTMLSFVACNNKGDENNTDTQQTDGTPALEFPDTPSEGLKVSQIDDQSCMIVGIGTCTDTMIRIPSEIEGLKVTAVYGGNDWRKNYSQDPIKGIMFPEEVTKIASYDRTYSFSNKLETIVLPDTPMDIDGEIFAGTPFYANEKNWSNGALYSGKHLIAVKYDITDTFSVNEGTLDIARGAFYESAATHVIIPDSVVRINSEAFMHCASLIRLTIGRGVTYIGESALYNCDALSRIVYTGSETEWRSIDKDGMRGGTTPTDYEVIYDWSDTETEASTESGTKPGAPIVSGTTDAKYFTFVLNDDGVSYKANTNRDYLGAINEYHIPAEYEGLPVTSVGLFGGTQNITVITLPDSVTSVDEMAFGWNPNLTTIKLSAGMTELPANMCAVCDNLNNVFIPVSVTKIGDYAFGECWALSNIMYEGTVEQWNAIEKAYWWYFGNPTTVTCSDGVIDIVVNDGISE